MLRFQGVLLALAPIVLAAPNDFKTCPKCIAAGYGWSTAKQKCGGFANKACPAEPPAETSALVSLDFDGEGKLGLSFLKGEVPPTIRKITAGSWGSNQPLSEGMVLHTIGDTSLTGRSYEFAVGFLRSQAATSSAEQPLKLEFTAVDIDSSVHEPKTKGPEDFPQSLQAASGAVKGPPIIMIEGKWGEFLTARAQALAFQQPCKGVECYADTLTKDLAPFAGGITKQTFEDTRRYNTGPKAQNAGGGGRMNHYQVIDSTLYGSEKVILCPARCVL